MAHNDLLFPKIQLSWPHTEKSQTIVCYLFRFCSGSYDIKKSPLTHLHKNYIVVECIGIVSIKLQLNYISCNFTSRLYTNGVLPKSHGVDGWDRPENISLQYSVPHCLWLLHSQQFYCNFLLK